MKLQALSLMGFCRVAGDQVVQELQPPAREARRLFAREPQNGHADWHLLSQIAAQCFPQCSHPQHRTRCQILKSALALLQSALESARLATVRDTVVVLHGAGVKPLRNSNCWTVL
jgi:hypothetical protein